MTAAIDRLNALDRASFIATLGSLYEHSPWVPERAFARRPFRDRDALAAALKEIVEQASDVEKYKLIRSHPQLAGEQLRTRTLSASSMAEQTGAGLDCLSDEEIAEWRRLQAVYDRIFGIPFIICVRNYTREQIFSELKRRIGLGGVDETRETMRQIHDIARLRLETLLGQMSQTM